MSKLIQPAENAESFPQDILLEAADEEIKEFEEHFKKVSGSRLEGMEKEILKTYIWWKVKIENVKDSRSTG